MTRDTRSRCPETGHCRPHKLVTSSVAQSFLGRSPKAWRDGSRKVLLTRALRHCDEVSLDGSMVRAAGLLCGQSKTADFVDAAVVFVVEGLARRGSVSVLTSDSGDIEPTAPSESHAARFLRPSGYQAYASGAVPPGPGNVASIAASVSGARPISRERSEAPSS